MFRSFKYLGLALAVFLVPIGGRLWALEIKGDSRHAKFARVTNVDGMGKFETSVVKFRSKSDPNLEVDLVSVVHVGEKAYYEGLNKVLDGYDAVLFEMVGPKGEPPPKIKGAYDPLARALKLECQMEHIDYSRPHFVHADMSKEEVEQAFKARGLKDKVPNKFELALASFVIWLKGGEKARWEIAHSLTRDDRADHPVVILDRNDVALTVLEEEIAKGTKRVAIFYGAGHSPDFERKLLERFDMTPVGIDWHTAWHLPKKAD